MRSCALVLAMLVACGKSTAVEGAKTSGSATSSGIAGSSDAPNPDATHAQIDAAATAPSTERIRAVLDAQIAALPNNSNALLGMFAKDAIVLTPEIVTATPDYTDIGHDIAVMNPHSEFGSAKVTAFHAASTAQLAWLAAEIEIVTMSHEPGTKPLKNSLLIRTVQLLDPVSLKVVAASFGRVKPMERRGDTSKVEAPTDAGPLAALLIAPNKLAASLANDASAAVFGTDPKERAYGPDAKTLLGTWSKLSLAIEPGKMHEVRTAGYGFVAADVNLTSGPGNPYRLTALLIAMPSADGGWTPVALHFVAL